MSSTLLRPLTLFFGYDLRTVRRSDSIDLHLKRFFSHHEIGLLLDVGAHVGGFSKMCRKAGYRGNIVSFEPARALFEQLQKSAAGDELWQVRQVGLGIAKERSQLNLNAGSNFNSLLPSMASMIGRFPALNTGATETIRIERLDAALDQAGIDMDMPIFLKTDTQGNDLNVLRGAGGRLRQVKGLLVEMSVQSIYEGAPNHWQMMEFVRAAGFEAYGFSTVSRDTTGGMIEYDALFKRIDETTEHE